MKRTNRIVIAVALVAALLLGALAALGVAGCSAGGGKTPAAESTAGAGASAGTETATPATFPVTVTDDASRSVTIEKQPTRIVSLAPANTEIVTAIGVPISKLVGVTTYDDYPTNVKSLPKMGDFMNPNIEAVTAAKPDLVLITGGIQNDVLGKLQNTGAKVVVVDPKTLDGLYESIGIVGKVTGETGGADQVVSDMMSAVDQIRTKLGDAKPTRVFMEIGFNPLFTVGKGTLIDDMIKAAGGANVVTQSGYVPYSVEKVIKDDPSVYFATHGGMGDPGAIAKRSGYSKIAAVKNGRVVILDDNLVSRPGPRVVEGIESMARALHPEAFKQ